jgi:putative ABC transport system permease protein
MFKNYLKIALRNIGKYKTYSSINIIGLAIGIACCILILLFVQDELSYDSYHAHSDHIYRLVAQSKSVSETNRIAPIGAPIAKIFSSALPEIRKATRLNREDRVLVENGNKKFFEERFFYADPEIFDVFSFPFIKGDSKTALATPFSVVLTESMAQKYFNEDDPIGQSIMMNNEHSFNITAVIQDVPHNSHFRFDFLASLETLADLYGERFLTHPGYMSFYTYLLLQEGTNSAELEQKFHVMLKQYLGEQAASMRSFHLQPLKSIHLHSKLEYEIEANSDMSYIYIYSSIAFFILLIASFNFMNLSTARSTRRAKEVGMRKVLGAQRMQLIKQFLGESVVLSFLSLFLAVILAELFLRVFNSLTGKELSLNYFENIGIFLGFFGIAAIVGIFAGLYPALFLSAFNPVRTLKGKLGTGGKSSSFRRFLVVAQFTITIILITGTLIIQNQLNYVRNRNLGFNKEQVVVIPIHDPNTMQAYEAIKTELMQNPSIISVTASSTVPGKPFTVITYRVEGPPETEHQKMVTYFIDYDFLETLGIELAAGRNFSKEFTTDESSAFILNETAVRQLGWDNPLNQQIIWPSSLLRRDAIVKKGRIIGVVKDFNVTSLHQRIEPVILQIRPKSFHGISARIRTENIPLTLAFLRQKFSQFSSVFPFEYSFLDDDFNKLYKADEKIGQLFGIFSSLAIFVACLGLLGLASFTAEQRTKEIGIRKVLGSSVPEILLLLSKEFFKWILVANIIAWPIAWYLSRNWLQNFAYRINIQIWVFILSGLLALAVALLTISYQSIKAALANPLESLRYE